MKITLSSKIVTIGCYCPGHDVHNLWQCSAKIERGYPGGKSGRILGHDGFGVIYRVGVAVLAFKPRNYLLISCVSTSGKCSYCRKQMYSRCSTGDWILGNTIDSTQAECILIPHDDKSLCPIPAGADQEALMMLSFILPTSFDCGVLKDKLPEPKRYKFTSLRWQQRYVQNKVITH